MFLYGRVIQWLQLKLVRRWVFFVFIGIVFSLFTSLGVSFCARYLVRQQVTSDHAVVGRIFLSPTDSVNIPVNIDGWYGDGNNRFFHDSSLTKILHLSFDRQVNNNLVAYMLYGDSVYNATDYQESWGMLGRYLGWKRIVLPDTNYINDLYTPLAKKISFISPIRSVPAGRLEDMVFRVSFSRSDLWDVRLDGIYWPRGGAPISMSFYWQKDHDVSAEVLLRGKYEMLRIAKFVLLSHPSKVGNLSMNVEPPIGFHLVNNSSVVYHQLGQGYVGYRWGGMPRNNTHMMYGGLFLPGGRFAILPDNPQ